MSDTLQSISISQTPLEQEIQKMNAILPDVLKTLEESETKKSWEMFLCPLMKFMYFPPKILHPNFQNVLFDHYNE